MASAETMKRMRDLFEIGIQDVKRACELAESDERFDGDLTLAVAYLDSAALAISVRSDRDGWNLSRAASTKARWIASNPAIAAFASETANP